jgi:hypothetical protein
MTLFFSAMEIAAAVSTIRRTVSKSPRAAALIIAGFSSLIMIAGALLPLEGDAGDVGVVMVMVS